MDALQIYIIIAIIVLAIIAIFIFLTRKKKNKISTLAAIAFAFILAGIIFSNDRIIGYSLIVIGIILAVVDMIKKSGNK